ncbi:MAG: mechanosensitive ion channel domain-containing protein, partial [bacterium]
SLRIELGGLQTAVDDRAQRRVVDLRTLDRLRQSWSFDLDHTRQAGAPDLVVASVEATLAAINATRAQLEQRNARLLVLQDVLSRSIESSDEAAARLQEARHRALTLVFARQGPPIWSIGPASTAPDGLPGRQARLSDEAALRIDSLRIYLQAYQRGSVLTLLLAFLVTLVLYRARWRVAHHSAEGIELSPSVAYVLRAPLAAALLVTILASRPLRPDPPLALAQLLVLITFPAAAVLLARLMDPRFVRSLYALALLLVVETARGLVLATPELEQVVLILEMCAAAALLFRVAAVLPAATGVFAERSPWLRRAVRALFRVVALAAAGGAVAAALGYLELADLVGGGGLDLIFVAIGLLGIRIAAGGVLVLALAHTPLARLRTVERHGAAVERGIGRALDVMVAVFWVFTALQLFELLDPAAAALRSLLDARLQVGALDLSLGRVVGVAGVGIVAWLVSRIVVFALEEDVYARLDLPRGVPYALSSLTRYGILLVGFFLALGALGLDLTHVTVLVSAFGLGIGFGLQQIINNFVSGLILLFERPIQIGDSIQLGALVGEVARIGIRSSTVRTFEGAEVIVPNASLLEEKVTNWTLSDRKRRVDLDIGVAYRTDAARVIALFVDVARHVPNVLSDPEPTAFFVGFGDSSLDFQVRVWTTQTAWMRLRSDLGVALQHALDGAGIEVPFPQRDLHVRSVPS